MIQAMPPSAGSMPDCVGASSFATRPLGANRHQKGCPHFLVIWTAGKSETAIPKIDKSWKIYALRGPLSAKALGLSSKLSVTDSAVLVRKIFNKKP